MLVVTFSLNPILGLIALTAGFAYAVAQRVNRSRVPAGLQS
jgi:hypothetical protein